MKVRVLTWHDQWRWVRQQYSWIKRYEERMYRSAGCPWYIRCICCWNFVYHQFWNMKRAHLLWYHVSPNYSWYTTAMYISTPFKVWCPKQQCKTMHSIGKRLGKKKKNCWKPGIISVYRFTRFIISQKRVRFVFDQSRGSWGVFLTWFQAVPVFDSKWTGYTCFWLLPWI